MESLISKIRLNVHMNNPRAREFLGEMIGTLFLVLLGDAAVAQMVFSEDKGSFLSVNWGYGFAVAFGVYICAGVSGGHLNPAISLSQFLLGNLKVVQLAVYCVAQLVGAFVGSAVLFAVYIEKLNEFDPNRTNATVGIWSTFPAEHLSPWGGLIDQIVATAVLSLCVLALTDKRNANVPSAAVPALVGLCVAMIGMTFGYNCGYAINPARDFGPRLFTLVAGWGRIAFNHHRLGYNWFWVPVVGPLIGACVGAWLYKLCVGLHWPTIGDELLPDGQEVIRREHTTETVYITKNNIEEEAP